VHAGGDRAKYLIPDEGIVQYLSDCNARMGAAYFQTPRDTVKDFVNLLNMVDQDPAKDWQGLVQRRPASPQPPTEQRSQSQSPPSMGSDNLSEFQL